MSANHNELRRLFAVAPDDSDWPTPQAYFDQVNAEFGFTLDAAASPANAKCERYFTPEDDGLMQDWTGVVWCNPPYGREIGHWIKKGYLSSLKGATVVMLVPASTDVAWFHEYAVKGELRFIRGRLKFGNGTQPAPFGSVLIIFRGSETPNGRAIETRHGSYPRQQAKKKGQKPHDRHESS